MFVDRVTIRIEAGRGGDGCSGFRREKYVPRGGPDGGDGGRGGSIILRAETDVDSLAALAQHKHWKAPSGDHGQGSNRHGRGGEDIVILVPPGTLVRDAEGGFVLKDLAVAGDEVVAARGGQGGKGNTRFKSAVNRAPKEFTRGEAGELRSLELELKMIADVGLTGKPNAGKSTLLSRMSRARPQIADYPFTTRVPQPGIVQVDVNRSFVMADIPGLIEGAHHGAGLGHEFLRHVERTRVLVHLVEPLPSDGTDAIENYKTIRRELAEYSAELGERPEIVAVSKCELPEAADVVKKLGEVTGKPVLAISAVTGEGLNRLRHEIVAKLDAAKAAVKS